MNHWMGTSVGEELLLLSDVSRRYSEQQKIIVAILF